MVDPFKALGRIIQGIQLRTAFVEGVQIAHKPGQPFVLRLGTKSPLHLPVFIPLVEFSQILSHKQQLFPGMGHQIGVGQPQARKFLFPFSGHLPQHGGLAVYHLVMREHQHKPLAVGIDHAEGQLAVVIAPEIRIITNIIQIVVHKAHVPLQVEAQPTLLRRVRDLRKGRTLLRDGKHPGISLLHDGIQVPDHFDGLQVFLSAVQIGDPLSVSLSVIQIEHAGHRVHADPVHMIFFHPEKGVGDQIVGNLRPAVIIDQRSPVGMTSLPGIPVLIETGSVKA